MAELVVECPNCGKPTTMWCTMIGDYDEDGKLKVRCPNCCEHPMHALIY